MGHAGHSMHRMRTRRQAAAHAVQGPRWARRAGHGKPGPVLPPQHLIQVWHRVPHPRYRDRNPDLPYYVSRLVPCAADHATTRACSP